MRQNNQLQKPNPCSKCTAIAICSVSPNRTDCPFAEVKYDGQRECTVCHLNKPISQFQYPTICDTCFRQGRVRARYSAQLKAKLRERKGVPPDEDKDVM